MIAVRALLARVRGEATFLVLLAVAAAGAWLYVQLRQAREDRDRVTHRAELICAASGTAWLVARQKAPGVACGDRVAQLAGFKAKADENSARLLADAMAANAARQTRDTQAARAAAEAANAAAIRMEAADAESERKNLVDREWFAAVNGVAGLRAPARPAAHR